MNINKIEQAISDLLEAVGEDPKREGLVETPKRVAAAYAEMFAGLHHRPTDFTDYKIFQVDENPEMVLVQQIPFYSMCEHHLLPFFGNVNVAYVPKAGKVIGISKIPRLVDFVSKRPGMQETLTTQINDELTQILDPSGVAVTVSARHLCMEMRGINKANQFTYTTKMTGLFKLDNQLRNNFFQQIGQQNV